jgi:UMF1 family MFS transporter
VRHYRDLFRFILTLTVYHAGIQTVVVLAAVYAQQVLGFGTVETLVMILLVNLTAAVGALAFGVMQDRLGSVPTLMVTLLVWILALVLAVAAEGRPLFWLVANLVGIAMGASQSAGRALVGRFSPPGRSAEFFGLWGLAVKLAAVVGPVCYGLIGYLSGGNHRLALLSTVAFFVAGLALLFTVDERRGCEAARGGGA